jgi:hypothetical protein
MTDQKKKTVKGIDEAMYETAKAIIVSGFKNNASEDDIKSAMFEAKVPFSALMRLYKAITINEGLIVSSKVAVANIDKYLKANFKITKKTADMKHEDFQVVIDNVIANVVGANDKRVCSVLKKRLAEKDIALPKKPKAKKGKSGKASKIQNAILDHFKAKKESTLEEFTAMITEIAAEKSVKKYVSLYKVYSALANGRGSDD